MEHTGKKTMAELTEMIIQADKDLTVAKARSDALRAHTLRLLTEQAASDGAAPSWRTTDGTVVSLDAWAAQPKAQITDEDDLVRSLAEVTPTDEIDQYATASITIPISYLDELCELAEDLLGPFGSVKVSRDLTADGRAWALSQAVCNTVCETVDLVDVETGEVLVEDVPGLTPVKARPRLVLRRKGKSAETIAAANAVLEEIANIT
jgi:hypothetical protein